MIIFNAAKRLAVIAIILSTVLIISCSSRRATRHSSKAYDTVELSEELLKKYRLTEEDMTQFQYFLADTLILRGYKNTLEKELSPDLNMDVKRTRVEDTIIFPKMGLCVAVRAWRDYGLKVGQFTAFPSQIILRVAFDDKTLDYLTFYPDDSGRYRILLEDGFVMFRNRRYHLAANSPNPGLLLQINDQEPTVEQNEEKIKSRKVEMNSF